MTDVHDHRPILHPLSNAFPSDRPWRPLRFFLFGLGIATYLLSALGARSPRLLGWWLSTSLGLWLSRPLSLITGIVPFAVWELLVLAYVAWLGWATTRAWRSCRRGHRRWSNAFLGGASRVARDAGVATVVFYLLWGFNYSRPSLERQFGWDDWVPPERAEIVEYAEQMVRAGNEAYFRIHGSEDAGTPTTLPAGRRSVDRALDEGWIRAVTYLNLPSGKALRFGRVKPMLSASVFARLGVSGMYMPFTGEANVRADIPAVGLAQSMSHEKAHQRGIAPEGEASFTGYVAGVLSSDPHAYYSAVIFAQRQLLAVLRSTSEEEWRRVADDRYAGVRRDLQDLVEYFRQFVGVGTIVGRAINDRYLRANRVEGGVANYGRSVRLLIAFARERSGQLLPPPGAASEPLSANDPPNQR